MTTIRHSPYLRQSCVRHWIAYIVPGGTIAPMISPMNRYISSNA